MLDTKICKICKKDLPISNFSKDSKAKDGLFLYCKSCKSEKDKNRPRTEPIMEGTKECNKCKKNIRRI